MRGRASGGGIDGAIRFEGGIFGIIPERLMMILEEGIGMARQRIAPAAGVPLPVHAGIIETIANGGGVIGPGSVNVVDGQKQLCRGDAGGMWSLGAISRIDRVNAVHGQIGVVKGPSGGVPT